ncbi:MAG: carotenoid biosynthesis protein [Deltaproteobacteria bacterium]|nr:carotenoid biosynthesis protein [Deltaproteobacteria bacterium]
MPETAVSWDQLLWGTLILRPYVFIFLTAYLCLATWHLGLGQSVIYLIVGYSIAWLSEFSSIHTGFPYGWYTYIPATRDQELWIGGVPFMDSLSYVFLAYASYSLALLLLRPYQRCPQENSPPHSLAPVFLAAVLFVTLDIIIDPLALRGYRWFLGQIYGYPEPGIYFGIPLSNFAGWLLVGVMLTYFLQRLWAWSPPFAWLARGRRSFPGVAFLGAGLYLGVLIFNLSLTFYIGETLLGLVGLFIYLPVTALALASWYQARSRGLCSEK